MRLADEKQMAQRGDPVRRVAAYSLLLNIVLVSIKLALSQISGSLSLRADAVHSMVDVFASLALILGLFISSRKSKDFPYGLYKVENVVSVIISILLFLTAYEIAAAAFRGGLAPLSYRGWMMAAVAALVPVPFIFGRYQVHVGRQLNSPSLIADGIQHQADVLTSAVVLVAFLGQSSGLALDRWAAVIIALFIIRSAWEILVSGMRVLLDASVDSQTLDKIRSLILEEPAVSNLLEVTARNSGRYLFVEASLALRISDLKRAHMASLKIEEKIMREVPHVDRVLIHYEPQTKTVVRYAIPLADPRGEIGQHFGESPYFALMDLDLKQRSLRRQEIVANPFKDLPKGKGLKVAEFLLSSKPDVVLTRESLAGKGPGYAFAEAGVETEQIEATTLEELVEELLAMER
jgi:cation diffusion facilitator family transporter